MSIVVQVLVSVLLAVGIFAVAAAVTVTWCEWRSRRRAEMAIAAQAMRAAREELEAIRLRNVGSWKDTLRMLELSHAIDAAKTPEEEERAVQAFERHFDERAAKREAKP